MTTTGRVFEGLSDIYEDQAQILFDYYRQAAERIVAEETRIEQEITSVGGQRQEAITKADATGKQVIIAAIVGCACALVTLIAGVPILAIVALAAGAIIAYRQYATQKAETAKALECDQRLAQLQEEWQSIRRDYRVDRIGVAYVPVARRVGMGDKSYVVDFTGDQPETDFTLTLINQPDELKNAMHGLASQMQAMPGVESNDVVEVVDTSDYSTSLQDVTLHDYMGTVDRKVRELSYLIGDNRRVSLSMPVVPPDSERYHLLDEYGTSDPQGHPIVPVFDTRDAQRKVEEFSSMGKLNAQSAQDGSGDVGFFCNVMRQLAQGVDLVSRSRTASMSQLVGYTSHILQNVLKASYNQYSPALEAAEIERIREATFNYSDEASEWRPFSLKESSRVRYDVFADAWVADNGARTALPFGMHQVDAEVLMPVIANLMEEHRTERLRIYSDIANQKTDYLNQWHRDTDDFFGRNRAEANELIQRMNEAYAEFVEAHINYEQQSAAFKSMKATGNLEDAEVAEAKNQAEVIAGFQLQTNQARAKQEEFTQFMEGIRADIDQCAEQFGHVEYYEASLRDYQARENARAIAAVRELDARRRRLATVGAYLAQHGDIPPEPNVSEDLDRDFAINLSARAEDEIRALMDESGQGYGQRAGA